MPDALRRFDPFPPYMKLLAGVDDAAPIVLGYMIANIADHGDLLQNRQIIAKALSLGLAPELRTCFDKDPSGREALIAIVAETTALEIRKAHVSSHPAVWFRDNALHPKMRHSIAAVSRELLLANHISPSLNNLAELSGGISMLLSDPVEAGLRDHARNVRNGVADDRLEETPIFELASLCVQRHIPDLKPLAASDIILRACRDAEDFVDKHARDLVRNGHQKNDFVASLLVGDVGATLFRHSMVDSVQQRYLGSAN